MIDELIYLFTGTSEIFIKNRMNRIIQGIEKNKCTLIKYDMEITPLSVLLNDAITIPFLDDYKIIILKNPLFLTKNIDVLTQEQKDFIKYLKKPTESTILMIDATNLKLALNNEICKTLKNVALIINYDDSQEIEIKGWVIRSLSLQNIEIKEDALTVFMEYLSDDQIRMEQEIEKLVSYVGKGNVITTDDVKLLVNKDLTNEIFNLITAMINKDKKLVYQIYQSLSSNTKDVMGIVSMITNTFTNLLSVAKLLKVGYSQQDIAKFYHVSPGRAYYMVKNAKAFKLEALENYVIKLATLDYQIKSGKMDKTIGIELLLLQI